MKQESKKERDNIFKKTWNFLYKDDSLLSLIISLIIIFLIIKFIFFPLLTLVFGTSLPLVIVESNSMHHSGNFIDNFFSSSPAIDLWWDEKGQWYLDKNLSRSDISPWDFRVGMEKGDIIFVRGISPENIEIGDVIIFEAGQQHPIIHRVIAIKTSASGSLIFETKGDNNSGQLNIEKNILENQIIGKAIYKVPKLGWVKLFFVELF